MSLLGDKEDDPIEYLGATNLGTEEKMADRNLGVGEYLGSNLGAEEYLGARNLGAEEYFGTRNLGDGNN